MTHPAVVFDHVSKVYSLSHQKTESLKDRLTRVIRGGKAPARAQAETESFYALRDVSFEIIPGESVGIIGPNGSGKSTSLKILAGVTKPSSGRFELNGRLGALIEVGAGFHPEMTGRENVYMNGSILGMSKKEIDHKFDSIVDFSEIEQFIDTPVKHYSSGMYVRLGFSVAIHNEPEIMLVDEVLAVGDLGFQKKCFNKMEELKADGRTFILVSHAMSQIQSMCDRAILLHNGIVVADGDTSEITGKYIDLSNPGMQQSSQASQEAQKEQDVIIESLRIIGPEGVPTNRIKINQCFSVEFDYWSRIPLNNPLCAILIKRAGMRIYSSNTRILGANLGKLPDNGIIRCDIPLLPLMPNEFDIEIYIARDVGVDIYGQAIFNKSLTIMQPHELSVLGCTLPTEYIERDVVFSPAKWIVGP